MNIYHFDRFPVRCEFHSDKFVDLTTYPINHLTHGSQLLHESTQGFYRVLTHLLNCQFTAASLSVSIHLQPAGDI